MSETPHRYTAELAGRIEVAWQDRWQESGTYHAPNPAGPVGRPGGRRRPLRRAPPRPRHVPLPERRRPPRRASAGVHRDRRLRTVPPDARQERPALPRLRRLRAPGRAVRRPDRAAPAQDHRGQHRHHGAPAAPPRPGSRRPPGGPDHRPRLLPLDAVDLPPDPRRLVRRGRRAPRRRPGSGAADRRAGGGVPLRRAPAAQRGRPGLGRPLRPRARHHPRRPASGVHERGTGQLVPGPRHGALQRGGHQRGPVRARQLPCLQAQPAPVDAADHGIRRPPGRRPRPGRTGPRRSRSCSATGSAAATARSSPSRSPPRTSDDAVARAGIDVFTTRPDTLFGATFMVLAPEHPLVDELVPRAGGPRAPRTRWTGERRPRRRRWRRTGGPRRA